MVNENTSAGPISAQTSSTPNMFETRDDELLFHRIFDGDLEKLSEMSKRDYWADAFWAMVGIGVGTGPTAIESLWNAYYANPNKALTLFGLIHVVLFIVAIIVGWVVSKTMKERTSADDLKEQIRNRTRYPVA